MGRSLDNYLTDCKHRYRCKTAELLKATDGLLKMEELLEKKIDSWRANHNPLSNRHNIRTNNLFRRKLWEISNDWRYPLHYESLADRFRDDGTVYYGIVLRKEASMKDILESEHSVRAVAQIYMLARFPGYTLLMQRYRHFGFENCDFYARKKKRTLRRSAEFLLLNFPDEVNPGNIVLVNYYDGYKPKDIPLETPSEKPKHL